MSSTLTRLSAVLTVACLLFTTWSAVTPNEATAQGPFTGYLMAHFTGESSTGQQIYLAHSTDGLRWTDLNNGGLVLSSTVGTRGVRDPSLVRSPAGDRYWIVATDLCIGCGQNWDGAINNGSRNLVVWESTDLVNWSAPWLLNVAGAIPDGRNAWAPEAIWNPATGDYVLYWATNVPQNQTKHRIYYARTTNFRTITTPQAYITRPGTQEIIDTQIVELPAGVGSFRYVRASGDGQITLEGSNSILGSWTNLGNLSGIGLTGAQVEGPMWMKFNPRNEWALYLDQYSSGRGYLPVLTANPSSPGSYQIPASGSYNMGGTRKRHGSILNLTAAEETRVLTRWGSTVPVNRIQSYNFQDRYVRHANFDVRIDPNVSPAQDAQFRMVTGLAGASGTVSIESVNYPNHFLRHSGFDFRLEANDGTTTFAADATFRQVSGLANSSWVSFQSFNYPDRYIRHSGYLLRLDPITDTLGRNDATFRVTT